VVLDEHSYLWGFNWISDKWLKSLPKDLQELVADGFVQMADVQFQYNKQYEGKSLAQFVAAGGKVHVPNAEQRATFTAAKPHMRNWFVQKYGKDWVEKLEKEVADAQAAIAKERNALLGR
jgi:TRAP-type transport system periplasmic protein